jgi:tetratricopeptide (TPR) repeat protein
MSPAAEKIIGRLDAVRQQWWLFTLLTTTVMAVLVAFAMLFGFMLVDALVKFSQPVLAGALVAWVAVTVGLVVLVLRRLTGSQRSLEATARCVETELPELGSDLINVIQLSGDGQVPDWAFREAAVTEAASRVADVRFGEAATKETRWRRFKFRMQTPRDLAEWFVALVMLLSIAALADRLNPNFGSAAGRLMAPWKFVPSIGSIKILEITPGDAEVLAGESLEITALIVDRAESEEQPYGATLFVSNKRDGEEQEQSPEESYPMMAGQRYTEPAMQGGAAIRELRRRYTLTLPSVVRAMDYRLEIGDTQSPEFHVAISEKPTIDEVEVAFDYPAYLGRPSETLVQKTADLEAPQYTVAELRIRPSTPIAEGYVDAEGQHFTGRIESAGALMVVRMPLVKNTTFTVHMANASGHGDPNPRPNRVRVLPDRPPTIELLKPPPEGTAAPEADVPVMIRAGDDHAVGQVRLEVKVKPDPPDIGPGGEESDEALDPVPETVVHQWTEFDSSTAVVLHHRLGLTGNLAKNGQTVMVRAVVRDNRDFAEWGLDLPPQETSSGWHRIRVIDEEVRTAAILEKLDGLRQAIFKILEKQIRAKVGSALIKHEKHLAAGLAGATRVRTLQVDVQKTSIGLVQSIGPADREERKAVKRILNQLAFGEMLQAVQQCDRLVKIDSLDGLVEPVDGLGQTQDRIIEVLRNLLDIARRAQTEELAEMQHRSAGDLPDDARQKLEDLTNALEKALEQQKKVVEAAENLAKAPVEDFSEAKEQLLKALEAAEDDWAQFMTELNTDLSKLPEQDFANASMLKELVEIQTEIKMAEDALLKKTADIAVPLEQLGAEMAEEIQTNMEKWLPDTPDRERWSQEESLTDEGKEAPMAELPGELEDLIGDLMEEEEDLFDEMEDVSSSAADSLDKGAGWDVADGPISNMSAKGATGNRLPNTSEIGGRAGEGRQGKSSGEFVGDEAIGKGGRNTPSRLTPDPYVAGQIKDHSKDPTGGATGGGKESGQGGEGLEGPAPGQRGQRELNRLAGKQASLRNKAEGIDLEHFKVMGYHHTDLQRMIELMARVERDLKAGRYFNAVRQRQVLAEGLSNVQQHLEGEFEVRQDTTVNLPTDVQEELLGSMQDPSPAGWETLNREYFERLSSGGAGVSGAAMPGAAERGD